MDQTDTSHLSIDHARRVAINLLTRRDHSMYEMQQKLMMRGYPADIIQPMIEELIELKYLSDERYTVALVSYHQARGAGPLKIQAKLKASRISQQLIAEHLKINDNTWFLMAKKVFIKRFGACPLSGENEKLKQIRYLLQRGFTSAQINALYKTNDALPPDS